MEELVLNVHLIHLYFKPILIFKELKEKGLHTATNYYFSESILWPDVKIAALKDAKEKVINHRYEARMIGVGMHQHQTAAILIAALAFDPTFARGVDRLLAEYGFNLTKPESLKDPLEKAGQVHTLISQKYYIDTLYEDVMVRKGFFRIFAGLFDWMDRNLVDGVVDLVGWFFRNIGTAIGKFQTGQVQAYATGVAFGVLAIILAMLLA